MKKINYPIRFGKKNFSADTTPTVNKHGVKIYRWDQLEVGKVYYLFNSSAMDGFDGTIKFKLLKNDPKSKIELLGATSDFLFEDADDKMLNKIKSEGFKPKKDFINFYVPGSEDWESEDDEYQDLFTEVPCMFDDKADYNDWNENNITPLIDEAFSKSPITDKNFGEYIIYQAEHAEDYGYESD